MPIDTKSLAVAACIYISPSVLDDLYVSAYIFVAVISPAKVVLLPEKVIGALVSVFEVPDTAHPATDPPVPIPSHTDELSNFSH